MHHLLETWFGWVLTGGYTGIIVLMAMESSIFPVPSEVVIPPAAFLAAQGKLSFAGVVLAGTFSVLGVLPLVALTEIGFTVAFGVLMDTLVVRTLLVPALTLWIGPKVWAPSALAHGEATALSPTPAVKPSDIGRES